MRQSGVGIGEPRGSVIADDEEDYMPPIEDDDIE